MFYINNMTQMSCNFREQSNSKNGRNSFVGRGGWAKPSHMHSVPLPPPAKSNGECFWRVFHVVIQNPPNSTAVLTRHSDPPLLGERAGWSADWCNSITDHQIGAKFKLKMANASLFISYIFNILWRLKVKSFKTPTVKKKLSSVLFISTAYEHILILVTIRGGSHYFCRDVSPVTLYWLCSLFYHLVMNVMLI